MLLIKITLTVFYAVLSLPFFPYMFFGMREEPPSSSSSNSKIENIFHRLCNLLFLSFIIGCSIAISYKSFNGFDGRQIWYKYLLPIAYPIFFQFLWSIEGLKRNLVPIVLPILALLFLIIIFIPTKNIILSYESPTSRNEPETPKYLNKETIKARFEADTLTYQEYKNGQHIYTIDGVTTGLGVLIVETSSITSDTSNKGSIPEVIKDGYTIKETVSFAFYPCEYPYSILGSIRDNYKTEEIVSLGIVLDNHTPYGKFGILKRTKIFEKPQINSYLLLNMVSGEITQHYEEALPQFARD